MEAIVLKEILVDPMRPRWLRNWERWRGILSHSPRFDKQTGDSPGKRGRVEVRLTESHNGFLSRRLTMRHRRCFSNASPNQILSLVLGMRFCGAGGLMVESTCDSEERFPDRQARFIKNFRPLGEGLGSVWAGAFDVRQELIECTEKKHDVIAIIRMSFSPARPGDQEPTGSFLWQIEPARPNEVDRGACWTELVNTDETRSRRFPELRIKPGVRWVFQLGHNSLMRKAAERVADLLNSGDDNCSLSVWTND